jgi:hypothetical protein
LSLTLKEAAEQVFEQQAFSDWVEEQREKREKERNADDDPYRDFDAPRAVTRTDAEARALADTPHLTGDPEWDAIELAETDPNRAPLSERLGH